MKILIVTNVYPNPLEPTKGIFNHCLARHLATKHEIRVISPISWSTELLSVGQRSRAILPIRYEVKDGVPVVYPRYYYTPRILRSQYGWFYWRSVRSSVRQVTDRYKPDVVVSFWVHPDGEAAVRAAGQLGVPSVTVVGGSDVLLLARDSTRARCVLNVLRSSDSVVAVSSDLATKIRTMGISPDKVQVWRRGIELSLFSPGNKSDARRELGVSESVPMLIWVGRMVPVKGLDVLIDAGAILHRRSIDFQLFLIGDGPSRRSLEAKCRSEALDSRVHFVGARLHDELPNWYRAADLTLLPSRSEGLPNVLRESLACGTPFVASDVGGIPELADGISGILVPPGDAQALALAISKALAKKSLDALPEISSGLQSWPESADSFARILRDAVLARSAPNSSLPE